MKKVWFSMLICWVFSNPLYAQIPSFESTTANIAAWNLSGFEAIPSDKAETFADAIAYIDPEIILLVEVNPDNIAEKIVFEFNEMSVCYKQEILDQTASMNIAILCKCDVELSNPRLIEGSDNGNSSLRKAFAVDIRVGEFDFILIGVHMKAGRGSSKRTIRDNQAQAIANFIQNATTGDEKDVLVIGDYNMIPGEDQSNFDDMNPDDFLIFISDGLVGQFSHSSSSGSGNLLDGYAISQEHTGEYIVGSLRIVQLQDILGLSLLDYRETISDHLPLDAMFRITDDDD